MRHRAIRSLTKPGLVVAELGIFPSDSPKTFYDPVTVPGGEQYREFTFDSGVHIKVIEGHAHVRDDTISWARTDTMADSDVMRVLELQWTSDIKAFSKIKKLTKQHRGN